MAASSDGCAQFCQLGSTSSFERGTLNTLGNTASRTKTIQGLRRQKKVQRTG